MDFSVPTSSQPLYPPSSPAVAVSLARYLCPLFLFLLSVSLIVPAGWGGGGKVPNDNIQKVPRGPACQNVVMALPGNHLRKDFAPQHAVDPNIKSSLNLIFLT
jgi:hypothetical protein